MTFNQQLTRDDAERLLKMPSAKGRAVVAGKIAQDFKAGVLSVKEREIAIAIFRLLVEDAATKVRSALASHLKSCVDLPKEIVHTLARDLEEEVSVPVLEFSRLLDDDELLAVIARLPLNRDEKVKSAGRVHFCRMVGKFLPGTSDWRFFA